MVGGVLFLQRTIGSIISLWNRFTFVLETVELVEGQPSEMATVGRFCLPFGWVSFVWFSMDWL